MFSSYSTSGSRTPELRWTRCHVGLTPMLSAEIFDMGTSFPSNLLDAYHLWQQRLINVLGTMQYVYFKQVTLKSYLNLIMNSVEKPDNIRLNYTNWPSNRHLDLCGLNQTNGPSIKDRPTSIECELPRRNKCTSMCKPYCY